MEIVAEDDGSGTTRLRRLSSGPPLTARQTLDGVTLVASAGGPLGGDVTDVVVRVGPGASLAVGSAAAAVVQPSRTGGEAVLRLDVEVAAGGSLRWRPRPTVVAARASYRAETTVRLAAGAVLDLCEVTVLGRHAEPLGSAALRLDVERDGLPVLRTETAWGPVGWPGSSGPAVLGRARVVGTGLVVGGAPPAQVAPPVQGARPAPDAEVFPLADDAWLVTVLAASTVDVEAALAPAGLPPGSADTWTTARAARAHLPGAPRKSRADFGR